MNKICCKKHKSPGVVSPETKKMTTDLDILDESISKLIKERKQRFFDEAIRFTWSTVVLDLEFNDKGDYIILEERFLKTAQELRPDLFPKQEEEDND